MEVGKFLKSREAEGKEKHVPVIEISKGEGEGGADIIHVAVGKGTPPSHLQIAWIEVFGMKRGGDVVNLGRTTFAPGYASPSVSFEVSLAEFKAFSALVYCNQHGLWENCLEVYKTER